MKEELELTTMSIGDLMGLRDQVNAEVERRIEQLEQLRAGIKRPRAPRKPRSDAGTKRKGEVGQ